MSISRDHSTTSMSIIQLHIMVNHCLYKQKVMMVAFNLFVPPQICNDISKTLWKYMPGCTSYISTYKSQLLQESTLFSKTIIYSLNTVKHSSNFERMLHQILCKVKYSWNHFLSVGHNLQREKKVPMISTVFVHLISSLVQRPSHSQVLDHLQCTKTLYAIQLKQDGEKKVRQAKKL